jgi:hypothetical protein
MIKPRGKPRSLAPECASHNPGRPLSPIAGTEAFAIRGLTLFRYLDAYALASRGLAECNGTS